MCWFSFFKALREAGYEVWAVADASGTTDTVSALIGNERMRDAGVNVVSWTAAVGELMRDWRQAPGGIEAAQKFVGDGLPTAAALYHSWLAAQANKGNTA
jgi:hypothetical protein